MKNKMSEDQKAKLIYSGELILFAVIFLVLAILKATCVIPYKETRRIIFNWITLVGSLWVFTDFIWAMVSKKRQKRIALIDKILVFPLGLFMFTFDLISLIAKPENIYFYIYAIASAFLYLSIIYMFEGIYHYFKPIPGLLDE